MTLDDFEWHLEKIFKEIYDPGKHWVPLGHWIADFGAFTWWKLTSQRLFSKYSTKKTSQFVMWKEHLWTPKVFQINTCSVNELLGWNLGFQMRPPHVWCLEAWTHLPFFSKNLIASWVCWSFGTKIKHTFIYIYFIYKHLEVDSEMSYQFSPIQCSYLQGFLSIVCSFYSLFYLYSVKLTYPLKIGQAPIGNFILQPFIFRGFCC